MLAPCAPPHANGTSVTGALYRFDWRNCSEFEMKYDAASEFCQPSDSFCV